MVSNSFATFILENENLLKNPKITSKTDNVYKKNIYLEKLQKKLYIIMLLIFLNVCAMKWWVFCPFYFGIT